jgi:conjugal transfer pilus assembly protein TraB
MMAKFKSLSDWPAFSKMSPAKRSATLVGVGAVVVMALAAVFTPKSQHRVAGPKASETNLAIPQPKDISNERLASKQEADAKQLATQAQKLAELQAENAKLQERINKGTTADPAIEARLNALADQIAALSAQKSEKEKDMLDKKLPPPQAADAPALDSPIDGPPPSSSRTKIRIVGGDTVVKTKDVVVQKPVVAYLPPGTFFEVATLNGMDAATNPAAQKNPVPVLARVKSEAILPNRFIHDVTECFVLMSGYGVMSSERALIRLESLSCTGPDGKVIQTTLDGYVVGEDGRVGMRGRLVSKQGQLVAKALAAGIFSGFGSAITPTATPGVNLNAGTSYQLPNAGAIASTAVGKGFSEAAQSASKFYLDIASQMTPIIEIDAARKVTVVLTKGIELK